MTKPDRLFRLFLLFILSFSLAACNVQSASPTVIPAQVVPTYTIVPNTGTVKGVILIDQKGKYIPLKNADLYLAKILMSPNGIAGVAALDASSDPRTSTDDQGAFLFQNIPPGKYGIVLYLVVQTYLLDQTDKHASMIITVDASKTTHLGTLKYTDFPITPVP